VPGDLTKRWVGPVIYGVLGLELAVVTGFAAAYNALDFAPPPPGPPGQRDEASLTGVQAQPG
jgi:hypothetical protein